MEKFIGNNMNGDFRNYQRQFNPVTNRNHTIQISTVNTSPVTTDDNRNRTLFVGGYATTGTGFPQWCLGSEQHVGQVNILNWRNQLHRSGGNLQISSRTSENYLNQALPPPSNYLGSQSQVSIPNYKSYQTLQTGASSFSNCNKYPSTAVPYRVIHPKPETREAEWLQQNYSTGKALQNKPVSIPGNSLISKSYATPSVPVKLPSGQSNACQNLPKTFTVSLLGGATLFTLPLLVPDTTAASQTQPPPPIKKSKGSRTVVYRAGQPQKVRVKKSAPETTLNNPDIYRYRKLPPFSEDGRNFVDASLLSDSELESAPKNSTRPSQKRPSKAANTKKRRKRSKGTSKVKNSAKSRKKQSIGHDKREKKKHGTGNGNTKFSRSSGKGLSSANESNPESLKERPCLFNQSEVDRSNSLNLLRQLDAPIPKPNWKVSGNLIDLPGRSCAVERKQGQPPTKAGVNAMPPPFLPNLSGTNSSEEDEDENTDTTEPAGEPAQQFSAASSCATTGNVGMSAAAMSRRFERESTPVVPNIPVRGYGDLEEDEKLETFNGENEEVGRGGNLIHEELLPAYFTNGSAGSSEETVEADDEDMLREPRPAHDSNYGDTGNSSRELCPMRTTLCAIFHNEWFGSLLAPASSRAENTHPRGRFAVPTHINGCGPFSHLCNLSNLTATAPSASHCPFPSVHQDAPWNEQMHGPGAANGFRMKRKMEPKPAHQASFSCKRSRTSIVDYYTRLNRSKANRGTYAANRGNSETSKDSMIFKEENGSLLGPQPGTSRSFLISVLNLSKDNHDEDTEVITDDENSSSDDVTE